MTTEHAANPGALRAERWLSDVCILAALGDPPRQTAIQVLKWSFLDRWLARAHPAAPAVVYGPIVLALGFRERGHGAVLAGAFLAGFAAFSLLEYLLHRFVLHRECGDTADDRIRAFVTHGYHHTYPNDAGRLVLPPMMTLPIAAALAAIDWSLLPSVWAAGVFAGTPAGYVVYDSSHWWLHHGRPRSALGRRWKRYHLLHHYDRELGRFGVTTPVWDIVFGTYGRRLNAAERRS
jgi:sterol desaturase/sphingolipid hydroxylase (fatty acid hydroxylase superfamily)